MQEVFGGVLTSDVTCGECGEVSSTRDPLLDLSLELQPARRPVRLRSGPVSPSWHCSLCQLIVGLFASWIPTPNAAT